MSTYRTMSRYLVASLIGMMAIPLITSCGANEGTSSNSNPASSPTGTPTPTPVPANSRTNPVLFGKTADVDGWTVKVISVTPERSDLLDGPPPAGTLFEVFSLQVTNTSSTPAAPSTSLLSDLVGSNNVSYSVISDPMCYGGSPDNDNVYKGGTVSFGACISIPTADKSLLLNVSGFSSGSTWFATT
jgi:hypothetical protein